MSEEWTLEELERRIKDSIDDSQDSRVLFGALFLKLYGRLPNIGLSGFQEEAATALVNINIPNPTKILELEQDIALCRNIISEISKMIEAEKGR